MKESDAVDFAKQARMSMSYQAPFNQDAHLAQWFIKAYCAGRDDADARNAEQVRALEELLKQKEDVIVSFGAANLTRQTQIRELKAEIQRLTNLYQYR